MIRSEEIVIYSLWNAHYPAVVAYRFHILGNLVAGIHGIISADIAEISYIVLLEYLKHLSVLGIVILGIRHLGTA